MTINASTTETPTPSGCTKTGFKSNSWIVSAKSAAKHPRLTMRSTSPETSAAGFVSHAVEQRLAFQFVEKRVRIVFGQRYRGEGDVFHDLDINTAHPDIPTISMGPKASSRLIPRIIS